MHFSKFQNSLTEYFNLYIISPRDIKIHSNLYPANNTFLKTDNIIDW